MSRSLYVVCKACEKARWVGQRNHLYEGPAEVQATAAFLLEHMGDEHPLLFADNVEWGFLVPDGAHIEHGPLRAPLLP